MNDAQLRAVIEQNSRVQQLIETIAQLVARSREVLAALAARGQRTNGESRR